MTSHRWIVNKVIMNQNRTVSPFIVLPCDLPSGGFYSKQSFIKSGHENAPAVDHHAGIDVPKSFVSVQEHFPMQISATRIQAHQKAVRKTDDHLAIPKSGSRISANG